MPTYHPIDGSGSSTSGGGSRGPGTSRRAQGGASPGNPAANPYLTRRDAVASLQRQYANRRIGPTRGVMRVFDALSTPAYAIGATASGDFSGALRNLYTLGQSGPKITLSRSPLFRKLLPDNALGTGLGLGIDILTDPLTYATGGAGGVARTGAAKAAREAAERAARESAERVIRRGAPLTLGERADVSARIAAELARVPGGIRVGIRVPFSRGRTITAPLLSSEDRVARAAANIARRLRTSDKGRTVGGWAHSGGAAVPEVNRVAQDLRRLASIEERRWTRRANDLQRRALRVERQAGLKRGELLTGISHHLENPALVNLPRAKPGTPTAVAREIDRIADDARSMLDELGAQEIAAGISRGEVENYVPHLLASEKDRKAFERAMGPRDLDPAVADSPFFTRQRQFETLDQMAAAGRAAGFTPETNIARIIQVRARASIRAQAKKALDDSVHGVHGKRLAPDPIPEVGPAAVRAVDERAALEDLLNPEGVTSPEGAVATQVATAEASRVEARARVATAREAYATARASGDESRIVPARAALRKAERQERKAALAVAAARNGHTDLPERVKAQLKATHKAERKLAVAEKKAGAARVLNAQAAARRGRPVTKEEYAHAAETWREVKGALKYNEGTLLPPDIAASLEKAYEIIDPAVRMEARGPFLSFMRNLTGRWKSLALLSPGYHTRNMIDDGMRMWFAGARNPNTFGQAIRVLTRGTGTVKIKGRTYTAAEIRALAESEGVIGTGHTFSEVISTGDDLTARRVRGPGRGPATRFSQWFGDLREDSSRLFLFMEMLKRGENAHEAGRITRWFLFDYGEVGRFVNSARNFWAPFLTYPSKALPQTIKLFATRPGIAANLNKTFMALEDLAQGGPLDRSELPPWMEDALLIPSTPWLRGVIGAPTDQPLLLDPSRVTGYATLGMLNPTREGLSRTAGETLHPALGFGAMQVFGFDTFKGRQMFPDERVYQPWVIQRLAELGVPIAGAGPKRDSYSGNTYPGYSPYLDSLLNLLPVFGQAGRTIPTDRSSSSRLGPFKFFTGLPISPLDRAKNAYWAQRFGRDGG